MSLDQNALGTPAGKPIVKLADVTGVYEMGHAGGGGLLNRRRARVTTVIVHALRGVSVDFHPGEYIAISGGILGSGKSTMLNLLGCLDRPTGGSYFLGGMRRRGLSTTTSSPKFAVAILASSFSHTT